MSNYVFDIPVYRCDETTHYKEYEKIKKRELLPYSKSETPRAYGQVEKRVEQEYWYPWKFNDIVGYLRLFIDGHRIKGDLFYAKAKRVVRGGKGKIFYYGKIYEYTPRITDTSIEIFENTFSELQKLKDPPLNRRHLDLEEFSRLGKLVDWKKLLAHN